jgi:hypothetical protein
VLAPLAVVALWRLPWPKVPGRACWAVAATAACSIVSLASFLLMLPATAAQREQAPTFASQVATGMFWSLLAVGAAATAAAIHARDRLTAATLALGSLLAVLDLFGYVGFWHHASLGLIAPLVVGVGSAGVGGAAGFGRLREWSLAWLLAMQALVWDSTPFDLLVLVAKQFRPLP